MFGWAKRLHDMGLLGMNQRNADYVMAHNPRRLYPLVDDKLRTKKLAEEANIAVPELYGTIEIEHDIPKLKDIVADHNDFVIKPSQGSGGNGIVVIVGKRGDQYVKASGDLINGEALRHHCSNILNGMYSLGGAADKAMIEYRVKFDPLFEHVSYRGVPDIRTIIFRGVPVAAMVRLPTRASDGKANLHQGAVGAGIDLRTGQTIRAVCRERVITQHPDTGMEIPGLQIPHWDQLLELAAKCYDLAGLGYMGVDVVLDAELGPLVLELNARPGLSIQIANGMGMLKRLNKIDCMSTVPDSAIERARLGKRLFGSQPEIPANTAAG
ncbi:MAG: alpha-L-glutamate ligase-like protein [Salinisphaeraceae bacterium]|nr:alpha-L-glutamate ligase-like protein [Salinisphaeraceae bacterium]